MVWPEILDSSVNGRRETCSIERTSERASANKIRFDFSKGKPKKERTNGLRALDDYLHAVLSQTRPSYNPSPEKKDKIFWLPW